MGGVSGDCGGLAPPAEPRSPKSERQPQIGERGSLRNGGRQIQLPLDELTLGASALDLFRYVFCLLLDPHKLCFSIFVYWARITRPPPIA
jgi:hypothetical protein